MDIFDYAIKTEIEGISYYKELSMSAPNKGLKAIFDLLVEEEEKHYELFLKMKEGKTAKYVSSQILTQAKTIFEELCAAENNFDFNSKQVDLYKKAQSIEEKTRDLYRNKASESTDENQKNIILEIAAEEDKHYILLGSIIDFATRPEEWVEHSEFNHLSEYYE
ncbi:MAG: ferritin family protein [Candidatus Omnitrophica bacterium]|nr:ferritin family protein [Candidatus Omnitrophota bacterium]